ncbi:MAG: hypothetical protein HOP11_02060 [Saprospiraceae bacterium]|nr:hypothetical protein [Saprospiraceae bacterium]
MSIPFNTLFLSLLLIVSCQPNEAVDYLHYETGEKVDLYSMQWSTDSTCVVAGGKAWFESTILITNNNGINWRKIELPGRCIFSICKSKNQDIFGCGIDKKIYKISKNHSSTVNFGEYIFFRSMDAWSDNHVLLVGGEAFRIGYIYKASLKDSVMKPFFEIERELNVIHCFDSLRWMVAGYGIVLTTENAGMKWDTVDASGDHFMDVSFIQDSIGYLCGAGGSIYKTRNFGRTWNVIRDASSVFTSNQAFRTICFKDENDGLVAGESGIVWKTNNGGKDWTAWNNLPCVNYYDIQYNNGSFWLIGSNGTIISIAED